MVQIQPLSIWKEGTIHIGSFISLLSVYDNLKDRVSFWFEIKEIDDATEATPALSNGNIDLVGDEYTSWDGSNNQAYTLIASKLSLTLV